MGEAGATYGKARAVGPMVFAASLVFVCFTLSSSGYLAWLHHLIALQPQANVDLLTMGAGYFCQAAGIGVAAASMRRWPELMGRVPFVVCLALNFACTAPAALGHSFATTMAAGILMNLLCGIISAFYLLRLSSFVRPERRGIVFGGGYACSIVASWLVSLGLGSANASAQLVACAVFSVIAVILVAASPLEAARDGGFSFPRRPAIETTPSPDGESGGGFTLESADEKAQSARHPMNIPRTPRAWLGLVALAGATVVLMSMVKNMGFNFPAADIGATISVEFSRLFYAAGLVIAGIVADRSRKHVAVLCMATLILPFALMALSNEPIPSALLWAVDYFFYGFFSVFRVVLFADFAAESEQAHLSGFGLMFGRIGDALGTIVCLSLIDTSIALVGVAAVMFVACVFAFWKLYQQLYMTHIEPQRTEREIFEQFAAHRDLSPREREVLRFVLDGHTNAEIAAELFVSESTVKFHMRNLLKKSGCKNRTELLALYAAER